jgi:hypothetical protein
MGILIVLLALFMLVLVAVAFAGARLFAGRSAGGQRDLGGCLTGCALALGLFALGGLGLVAFVVSLSVQAASVAVEHFPIRSVHVGAWPEDVPRPRSEGGESSVEGPGSLSFGRDPSRPLHLIFEIEGHDAASPDMRAWIDEWSDGEALVHVENDEDAEGAPITWVDVSLPASRGDLRKIEREVRKLFPEASWAKGLHIEFRGASREW